MKLPKVIVILFALFNLNGILAQEKKTYYFNEKFDLLNETDFKKLTENVFSVWIDFMLRVGNNFR